MCVIDNCCSWRNKLQTVFGRQLKVLLDLFHIVQRVVKLILKKHPFAYRCCQSFRKVFHHPSDIGEERSLSTRPPNILENNLNVFLNSWKDIKYKNVSVVSVKKAVFLICLQDVALKGMKTCTNVSGRLLQEKEWGFYWQFHLSLFLYTWNEKRLNSKNSSITSIVRPLISRKSELLNNRPITDETFGIGVCVKT